MQEIRLSSEEMKLINQQKKHAGLTAIIGLVIIGLLCFIFAIFGQVVLTFLALICFFAILLTNYFNQKDYSKSATKLVGNLEVVSKNIIHDPDDENYHVVIFKSSIINQIYLKKEFWNEIQIGDYFYIEIVRNINHLLIISHSNRNVKTKLDYRKLVEVNQYAII